MLTKEILKILKSIKEGSHGMIPNEIQFLLDLIIDDMDRSEKVTKWIVHGGIILLAGMFCGLVLGWYKYIYLGLK